MLKKLAHSYHKTKPIICSKTWEIIFQFFRLSYEYDFRCCRFLWPSLERRVSVVKRWFWLGLCGICVLTTISFDKLRKIWISCSFSEMGQKMYETTPFFVKSPRIYQSISRTFNIFRQNENITIMEKLQKGSRANIHFFRNCWPTFKASGLTGWWYDNHKGGYLDIFTRYFI